MAFVDANHCLRSIMSDPNLAIRYLETRIEPILVAPVDAVSADHRKSITLRASHVLIYKAYSHIEMQRIACTEHLKGRYPFLFSQAVNINPLNPNASPIIKE